MHIKRINLINTVLLGIILLLVVIALLFMLMRPSSIDVVEKHSEGPKLPAGAFNRPIEEYKAMGPPFLNLKFSPMSLQVPDLKKYLVYYGKNDRPDADLENQKLNFGFAGTKGTGSARIKEPVYLLYDKYDPKVKYKFSPANSITTLWFEASPVGATDVAVSASIRNESGEVVREPLSNAEFVLKERPFGRVENEDRRIGDFKIDGTLLSRQGAKWYGIDKFMERHGGEEYKDIAAKQRIDFGTGNDTYSIYIGPDTVLAWINGKWKEVKPGPDSVKYPIMAVNKIDDRIMKLDLWDLDGQGKTSLNLIKSMETWMPQNIQKEFSFIGARTRSQFLFEINKERITLSPMDWLLRTEKGWKKLTTVQDIDDYVERKITGPLFIFDGVEKKDGKQLLIGTLFNKARTEMKTIEILMTQGASITETKRENLAPEDDEEEDEDEIEKHPIRENLDPDVLKQKMMDRIIRPGDLDQ